jgi:hypothetical protein
VLSIQAISPERFTVLCDRGTIEVHSVGQLQKVLEEQLNIEFEVYFEDFEEMTIIKKAHIFDNFVKILKTGA